MDFKIGHRVRMQRTENYGVVTAILPGGLVEVRLDGGKGELPIPADILERVEATPKKDDRRPRLKKRRYPPPKLLSPLKKMMIVSGASASPSTHSSTMKRSRKRTKSTSLMARPIRSSTN